MSQILTLIIEYSSFRALLSTLDMQTKHETRHHLLLETEGRIPQEDPAEDQAPASYREGGLSNECLRIRLPQAGSHTACDLAPFPPPPHKHGGGPHPHLFLLLPTSCFL